MYFKVSHLLLKSAKITSYAQINVLPNISIIVFWRFPVLVKLRQSWKLIAEPCIIKLFDRDLQLFWWTKLLKNEILQSEKLSNYMQFLLYFFGIHFGTWYGRTWTLFTKYFSRSSGTRLQKVSQNASLFNTIKRIKFHRCFIQHLNNI